MSFYSDTPIVFGGVSATTLVPGPKDPELGARCNYGGNLYVYVYNDADSFAYPGMIATPIVAGTGYSFTITTTAGLDIPLGVVRNKTFASYAYGWILYKGYGPAYTSAAIAAGVALQPAALGLWTTGATFCAAKLLVATSAATTLASTAYFNL
jgi:hypothetical protein